MQTRKTPSSSPDSPAAARSTTWHLFRELKADKRRFEAGLALIEATSATTNSKFNITEDSFPIDSRNLYFTRTDTSVAADEQTEVDMHTQQQSSVTNKRKRQGVGKKQAAVDTTLEMLRTIDPLSEKPTVLVRNAERREEVFAPMIFGEEGKEYGLYVYPWHSGEKKSFVYDKGFQEFVTAVCLVGSSLEGVDQMGNHFSLIKHDIKFFVEQQVQRISYIPGRVNPFELLTFAELEKLTALINKFSSEDKPKSLRVHLPWMDYILFGLELFIRGRMTRAALNQFAGIILDKKAEYIAKITAIFTPHNIKVHFESPFENLLANPETYTADTLVDALIQLLGLPNKDLKPTDFTAEEIVINERKLAQLCLDKLRTNNHNPSHKAAWQALAEASAFEKVIEADEKFTPLEKLFQLTNAAMIAISSNGKKEFSVCSLLPLSEKQIQISYASHSKRYAALKKTGTSAMPAVAMLTFIPPLTGYDNDSTNSNSMFYFPPSHHQPLAKAIGKGLIEQAVRNTFLFSRGGQHTIESSSAKRPVPVEEIMTEERRKSSPILA